ncbi:MAG TPA: hypothetical protein ENN03_04240 [bacterium]|nr:hypothetical protein [bacterium]
MRRRKSMRRFVTAMIVYGWMLASNGGAQLWKGSLFHPGNQRAEGPTSNAINAILAADGVWIGTGKELLHTTDGGATWRRFTSQNGLGRGAVSAIAGRNGTVWVATAVDSMTPSGVFPAGTGLSRTTDGGLTWQWVPQPVDDPQETRYKPTTTVIQNLTYDIAVTEEAVWIASWGGGLRRSADGADWEVVTVDGQLFDALGFLTHVVFSVYFDGEALWVGSAGGIHRTTDEGETWATFSHQNQEEPISGNFVVAIAHQELDQGKRIWASTVEAVDTSETRALSYSDNNGQSWSVTLQGEFVHNMAFHSGGTVYAVSGNGLFASQDAFEWTRFPQIYDTQTGEGLYTTNMYSVGVETPYRIYLGSNDGLAVSPDGGVTWTVHRAFAVPGEGGNPDTYAYPNPFSPMQHNRVGGDGYVRFQYRITRASSVSVHIYDFSMRLVRTAVKDRQRTAPGSYSEVWDGRNDVGEPVANGVYFYRIRLSEGKTLWGKVMVVN